MANYVKFRRGTPEAFSQLDLREPDTLYFIYKEDESTAELYLGSKKISGEGGVGATNLSDLKDIIINNVNDKDLLVYDSEQGKWINKTVDEVLANYVSINEPTIVSIENNGDNSHQDLIDEEFNSKDPKAGDIIIIKDIIASNKY